MSIRGVRKRSPVQRRGGVRHARSRLVFAMLLAAVCGLTACDEQLSSITGPTPNLVPTFSSIQREIFENSERTGCVTCHTTTGRVPAGGLSLLPGVAYANLVNARSFLKPGAVRVVPGDPDASYLIHKLEGRRDIVGVRMPLNGPPFLTDGQILVIRQWIRDGAPNN